MPAGSTAPKGKWEEKVYDFTPGENAPELLMPNVDRRIEFKVAKSGGVSVYGVNSRTPVTLYPQQWVDLAPYMDQLLDFIQENKHLMSWKGQSTTTKTGRTIAETADPQLAAMRLIPQYKGLSDARLREILEATK